MTERESLRDARYQVNVGSRIREILGRDEIPETAELSYSFDEHGVLHFKGAYHPDGTCDGDHICSFCGSVHTL